MLFRAIASPKPSKGVKVGGKKLVVPNQALSLRDIIERFTRNEAVPVGREVVWDDDAEIDLEKLSHADIVDKMEYRDEMIAKQKAYQKQEKRKAEKLKADAEAKALEEARQRIEAEASKGKVNP